MCNALLTNGECTVGNRYIGNVWEDVNNSYLNEDMYASTKIFLNIYSVIFNILLYI